ncbi:hypothetical protein [Streptomyces lomondensis]|nr:hypothetical protein [Streptomyces lomondensis]MCF0077631.1 hypothetical protein [Streptomyces lomondensis]
MNLSDRAAVSAPMEQLAAIPPRALQSVLIGLQADRAARLAAHDVYRRHMANSFTAPSELDQRDVVRFLSVAMDAIPESVRMKELSPVAALGSSSALSSISQKTVLGTIRNTEVVADGLSVLTLEAARQRKAEAVGDIWPGVTLGTFHRELRTQTHSEPGFKPHYHALSLLSAESTPDFDDFKVRRLAEHLSTYLAIIDRAESIGYAAKDVTVAVSNLRVVELLIKELGADREHIMRNTRTFGFSAFDTLGVPLPKQVELRELPSLARSLPARLRFLSRPLDYSAKVFGEAVSRIERLRRTGSVNVVFDLERHAGMGYYQDLVVKMTARNMSGETYSLVDMGTNDWLSRITNRRGDRLMTGGMGSEVFLNNFRKTS